MALAEKLNQSPEKKGGEPKRKGRREIIPFITVAALTAAGGAALITPQGEVHAQGPNPTPTPEPSPTPTESGAIIPGVEAGETLAMGGTNWHITKFDAAYYASLLSQLEEKFTIIDNGNGLVFNLSYFDSQSRLSIILPHGPQGFEWDGKNQIWRNPQNPNAVLLPQIALPGGWNEEKNIAGPAVVPEVVLMLKDSQRNIRIGTIYNNEALRSAGIVDSNIIPLDNNRSIFLGNPKNLELEKGQRIEAIYDEETNQILYHKLINRDGSWKKILTSWDQVTNAQQVKHMFEPIGIQISDEITDVPYPSDSLMTIENPNAPIPQFANALNKAGINISAEEIKSRITYVSTKEDGTPLVDKDGNPFVVAVYKTGQQQEQRKLSVISQSLNLRSGPSTNDGIITSLPYNTVLTPTGEKSPDGSWIQVRTPDGQIGWVFSQYTQETQSTQDNSLIDNIPLLIATKGENGEWRWSNATNRLCGKKSDILTGAFFGGNNLGPGDFEKILNIIKNEFSLGGIWIGMSDLQPNENQFKLTNLGLYKNVENSLYHPLIWFDSAPDWIRSKDNNQLKQSLIEHVRKISSEIEKNAKRSGGSSIIVVVNEARHPRDFYYQKLGDSYIEEAFRTARESSPSSILIYNDYNNHTLNGERYRNTLEIVNKLKALNLIDGVGIQLVIDGSNPPTKQDVIDALRSYGVNVYITEFSVNMRNVSGSQEERIMRQAKIYHDMTRACVESGVCKAFVDFQIGDKFSVWENNQYLPGYSPNADPTPYDDNLNPKLALYFQRAAFLP